jgi:enamine deaminase RidA (YjgF/YER057c/UK114 family)
MKALSKCLALVAVFTCSTAVQAVDLNTAKPAELFKHLRASKVYVNSPELPRFGYSNAVVVNNWTRPLTLPPVAGSDETAHDLELHTQSAIQGLKEQLHAVGVSKEAILAANIYFDSAGDSFDNLIHITSELNQFMAGRLSYVTNPPALNDLPVRNVHGVKSVANHLGLKDHQRARVAFQLVVLDPATTSSERVFDTKASPARSDGKAHFIIGGMMGQNMAFNVPSDQQPKNLLANLDKVLDSMGASRGNIEKITLRYTSKSNLSRDSLRSLLNDYFAKSGGSPKVAIEEIDVAGFAANDSCVAVEGAMPIDI